jgi:hypothetical protein
LSVLELKLELLLLPLLVLEDHQLLLVLALISVQPEAAQQAQVRYQPQNNTACTK